MIVGEGGAGKTSLAKKIEDENYKLNSDEKSTEGIDVIKWKFPLPNGQEFRVNIWDFGGQEIYHETHQFFLSKRSFYILVADSREENTNFYWWLKVVELLSENSPVLIIKNEKQNRSCNINERELRGEFSSFEMVNVRRLIDDVNLSPQKEEFGEFKVKNTPLQRELEIERELNLKVRNQNQIEYEDFQVLVDENNNIRVSSSQGDEPGRLNLDINKINLTLKLIESGATNKDLFKALGSELYQTLFPNQINARFHATIASAQEKKKSVRLRLIFDSPQLASLPWEFLYDEGTDIFLGNNTHTVLSRYIDVPLAKREIKSASLPLKVLLVISSPSNLNKLDATGEENLIREALKKQIDTNKIELDVLTEATTSNIRQKLREKSYNVFHFIGHGDFKDNQGSIFLVDEYGQSKSLDDENFANFFLGNNHLGLVILNCCKGGRISSNQAMKGTVSNLVRRGIPAAVAMQYTILDSTAKPEGVTSGINRWQGKPFRERTLKR